MKKIISLLLILMAIYMLPKTTKANNHYQQFEQFNLINGKMLENYTDSELKKHYAVVDKAKMFGWKTVKIGNRLKATFISETVFSYYNDGYTAIDYNYKAEAQETQKTSYSSTGSIGLNLSGTKNGYKGGLDAKVNTTKLFEKQTIKKETYQISLKVDPGTQINLYSYGEGYLTNGVAAKYFFWIRVNRGGFEFFEISTIYYRLEKVKI